jgi:hypothetical protein
MADPDGAIADRRRRRRWSGERVAATDVYFR